MRVNGYSHATLIDAAIAVCPMNKRIQTIYEDMRVKVDENFFP